MDENLVGYLLNALDESTQRQVEEYLRSEPGAQRRLDLLRRTLKPLELDRDQIEPPAGLAERTVARARTRSREIIMIPAPPARSAAHAAWWHRSDVLVAAGLLICVVGLGAPGLYRLRSFYQNRSECSDNMRVMHQALVGYADNHGGNLPQVEDRPRRNMAGVFVPTLNDAGVMTPGVNVRCASNGRPTQQTLTLTDLDQMSQDDFDHHAQRLSGCYAYTLGYRDAQGRLHGYRIDDPDDIPILADKPLVTADGVRGNSPNHASGQNILYIGGNVRFTKDPAAGIENDHIYLNRLHKVAAGVDRDDAVLGTSIDKP